MPCTKNNWYRSLSIIREYHILTDMRAAGFLKINSEIKNRSADKASHLPTGKNGS